MLPRDTTIYGVYPRVVFVCSLHYNGGFATSGLCAGVSTYQLNGGFLRGGQLHSCIRGRFVLTTTGGGLLTRQARTIFGGGQRPRLLRHHFGGEHVVTFGVQGQHHGDFQLERGARGLNVYFYFVIARNGTLHAIGRQRATFFGPTNGVCVLVPGGRRIYFYTFTDGLRVNFCRRVGTTFFDAFRRVQVGL